MIIYNPNSCLYLIISNHSDYDLTIIRIIHQNLPIHPIDSIDPISWVCGNVVIVSQQAAIKGTPDDSSPSGGHGMGWRPTWRHRRRWAQRPRRNLLQVGLLGEFEVQHAPKLDITGCLWNSVNHFESFWIILNVIHWVICQLLGATSMLKTKEWRSKTPGVVALHCLVENRIPHDFMDCDIAQHIG